MSMTSTTADDFEIPFERSREDQAWARWLARSLDGLLLTPAVFLAFGVLGVLVELGRAPIAILDWMEQPILAAIIELAAFFVLMALWEPLFISNARTTPGKWLMGIRVRRTDGAKLSYLRALNRFIRVWFVGMAAGIPLLSLIAMLIARGRLTTDGAAVWDEQLDCTVEHRKRHPLVWTLLIVIVVGTTITFRVLGQLAESGGY
jgi:uncharacterized RDD family membrane protein YckC